jgi:malic enzyme
MGAGCSGANCTDANCVATGGGCAGCECCGAVVNNAIEGKKGRRNSGVLLIEERQRDISEEEEKKKRKRKKKKKDEEEKEETKGDPKFKSEDVKLFIRKCLTRSGVFQDEVNLRQLTEDDIDKIVDAFEMKTFEDGQYLFHKGQCLLCAQSWISYTYSRNIHSFA